MKSARNTNSQFHEGTSKGEHQLIHKSIVLTKCHTQRGKIFPRVPFFYYFYICSFFRPLLSHVSFMEKQIILYTGALTQKDLQ